MKTDFLNLSIVFSVFISAAYAQIDYTKFGPDSPEVEQAALEAVKKLGPDGGAVSLQSTILDIFKTSMDITGLATGFGDAGVDIISLIEDIDKVMKDLDADVTETEIALELPSDILFDFDKSEIRSDAEEALHRVSTVISAYPGKTVTIEGHTDAEGDEEYNLQLSIKRAESVKTWLLEKESLINTPFQTKGWGESKPRESNDTEAGRQKNRRVEIYIKK